MFGIEEDKRIRNNVYNYAFSFRFVAVCLVT